MGPSGILVTAHSLMARTPSLFRALPVKIASALHAVVYLWGGGVRGGEGGEERDLKSFSKGVLASFLL